jgi:hypothetical protein
MIIHNWPEDFRLSRIYAFCDMPGARYSSERAISIDSKGLSCVLNDVGSGYAQAAAAVYNSGVSPASPRALAYRLPQESWLFKQGDGWRQVDFIAMPVRFHPASVPTQWQLFAHADDGWAAAGMVHFQRSGQGFLVPAGQSINFSSLESIQASVEEGLPLPGHIGAREMIVGVGALDIQEMVAAHMSLAPAKRWRYEA